MISLDTNSLVWGIVGNLGGGKTLTAVSMGVSCLRQGYYVVSNVTFNMDIICRDFGIPWAKNLYKHISLDSSDFDPFKLPCGSPRGTKGGKRVVVILDEVAEWFDQYSSAKDYRISRIWSWLRHSSKRSQDVIIICQRQEFINKVVRSLISRWVWVDDLAVYRIPKIKLKFPFCSDFIMQNVFDRLGNKIASVSFIRKSNYGRFYNTAECLNNDGASYNFVYDTPSFHYNYSFYTISFFFSSLFYLILTTL